MTNPLDDALASSGAKSAFNKTSQIGDTITGPIVDATIKQRSDYYTKEPKYWNDGKPQNQVVVRIQTPERLDDEDDGIRGVYIKTWGTDKEALLAAIKEAGGSKASDVLIPGATFTATFTSTKPSDQGDDAKLYQYAINPNGAALDQAVATPAPAAAPTPVAPPASAPQPTPAQPVVPAGDDITKKIETVKALIQLGQPDEAIAGVTGLDLAVIAATRNTL